MNAHMTIEVAKSIEKSFESMSSGEILGMAELGTPWMRGIMYPFSGRVEVWFQPGRIGDIPIMVHYRLKEGDNASELSSEDWENRAYIIADSYHEHVLWARGLEA